MTQVIGRTICTEAELKFDRTMLTFTFPDGSVGSYPFSQIYDMYRNGNGYLVVILEQLNDWKLLVVTNNVEVN